MVLGSLDHLAHAVARADVARIDPEASRTGRRSFDRPLIVEVDVGDDRHRHLGDNLGQRFGRVLVRAGNPHYVRPGHFQIADLLDGGRHVGGQGVGHGLHRNGCIAADRHLADMDLPRHAPLDISIWPDAHGFKRPCYRL